MKRPGDRQRTHSEKSPPGRIKAQRDDKNTRNSRDSRVTGSSRLLRSMSDISRRTAASTGGGAGSKIPAREERTRRGTSLRRPFFHVEATKRLLSQLISSLCPIPAKVRFLSPPVACEDRPPSRRSVAATLAIEIESIPMGLDSEPQRFNGL